jgi:hypothetical protein
MVYVSETKIGIGSRRSVRRHSLLTLSHTHISLAEGNPDEEKIGAFGVGGSVHHVETIIFSHIASTGFYSLFSVTEEPWVTSGGTPTLLIISPPLYSRTSGQWMNFYWKDKKDQVRCLHSLYSNLMPITCF